MFRRDIKSSLPKIQVYIIYSHHFSHDTQFNSAPFPSLRAVRGLSERHGQGGNSVLKKMPYPCLSRPSLKKKQMPYLFVRIREKRKMPLPLVPGSMWEVPGKLRHTVVDWTVILPRHSLHYCPAHTHPAACSSPRPHAVLILLCAAAANTCSPPSYYFFLFMYLINRRY